MSTASLSFAIVPSQPDIPLGLEVWLDNNVIFNQDHVFKAEMISHDFDDLDDNHQLRFVLKHKLPAHTTIDADNNITSDASIRITDIMFENIDITHIVSTVAEYQHDFNGHGPANKDKFYGDMGCNGTVGMKFTTPIYLWLLEKM